MSDAEVQRLDVLAARAKEAVILSATELVDSAVPDFEQDRFIIPKERFAALLGALTRYQMAFDDVLKHVTEAIAEAGQERQP